MRDETILKGPRTFIVAEVGRRSSNRDRSGGASTAALMLICLLLLASQHFQRLLGPGSPVTGAAAPGFRAPSVDSAGTIELSDHRGKVVLLHFWATWCGPCVRELPHFDALQRTYGSQGFTVLGVNQEPGAPQRVRGLLEAHSIQFPNVLDPGDIAHRYGVTGYPEVYLIDRGGRVRQAWKGPPDPRTLERTVQSLIAHGT